MTKPSKFSRFFEVSGPFVAVALIVCWIIALYVVGTEKHQGEVYRIIYLHVPAAFTAFTCSFILFIQSILLLKKGKGSVQYFGRACAEVGLIFTVLTLATGSIWGKPTWGTWWTWDARLTTTFLLGLMYGAYLLLWNSMDSGPDRNKACAVLGILIFVDVPIIYKSVTWWRTLHQPPSIMRDGGSTMAPEILTLVLTAAFLSIFVSLWMTWSRYENLKLREQVESQSISS